MGLLEFKQCKRYKESIEQEHCPFDCVCMSDCYFTNKKFRKAYEELSKDYYELEQESWSYENLENELDSANDEITELKNKNEELTNLIKCCIKKLDEISLQEIKNELDEFDYCYNDIRNLINEQIKSV